VTVPPNAMETSLAVTIGELAVPTVKVNVVVPEFVDEFAVNVYVVNDEVAVGVPLITPVEVLRVNPAGRDGEME
jgi:hypothetical protein